MNSRFPLRPKPSAMLDMMDTAALRIWSRKEKSLANDPLVDVLYTSLTSLRAFCQASMSSNRLIFAIIEPCPFSTAQLTTLNPQLSTSNPQHTTLNPQPSTHNSQPPTPNSQPSISSPDSSCKMPQWLLATRPTDPISNPCAAASR